MALLEDVLEGNLVVAAAIGGTALLLPKVMPHLSPQVRSVVRGGIRLFLEAQSEAEIGIVTRMADQALKDVLDGLSDPGSAQERKRAAQAAIKNFKRRARRRARHYGHDPADRAQRYHRHIAALHRAIDRASARHPGPKAAALRELYDVLQET